MSYSNPRIVAIAFALLGATALSVPPAPAESGALACGSVYVIKTGDTLFKIATWAYGDGWRYKTIFAANRDLLPEPAAIEIGDQIFIPCLDGSTVRTRREAKAQGLLGRANTKSGSSTNAAAAGEPAERHVAGTMSQASTAHATLSRGIEARPKKIGETEIDGASPSLTTARFLTGPGFTPYTDPHLTSGGMITELLSQSLAAVAPDTAVEVNFVADWAAHPELLRSSADFDVAFPWLKPNCENPRRLTNEMQRRCMQFEFSTPFFEIPVALYTRAGEELANAAEPSQLSGKRLCRPDTQFMTDLQQGGLLGSGTVLETSGSGSACFMKLIRGQVDVVAMVRSDADDQVHDLQITDAVAEIHGLASVQTLHAVASKTSPRGRAYLEMIDRGLARLMTSGEWFRIVAFHRHQVMASIN